MTDLYIILPNEAAGGVSLEDLNEYVGGGYGAQPVDNDTPFNHPEMKGDDIVYKMGIHDTASAHEIAQQISLDELYDDQPLSLTAVFQDDEGGWQYYQEGQAHLVSVNSYPEMNQTNAVVSDPETSVVEQVFKTEMQP